MNKDRFILWVIMFLSAIALVLVATSWNHPRHSKKLTTEVIEVVGKRMHTQYDIYFVEAKDGQIYEIGRGDWMDIKTKAKYRVRLDGHKIQKVWPAK